MIDLEKVSKYFAGDQVLKEVTLKIDPGERVSIVGPGGCGKSTLLKLILGLVSADDGKCSLFGLDLASVDRDELSQAMKRVGMAFQQGGLFDFMTVRENLLFAMEHMAQLSKSEMNAKAAELLEGVKLSRTMDQFPHELSGGMKRRVGIARALCTNPELAIFDEPTSGLDPVTSTIILNMIGDLAGLDKRKALVVASSNVEIAIRFAKRVVVLNEDGGIHADGHWAEMLVSGDEWLKHFLGVRFIGLDLSYAKELNLPKEFIAKHWY